MPSLTEFFGYTVTNLGPLTTTYTPPPACTTETTDHVIFANKTSLEFQFGAPTCGIQSVGKCFPSGAAYDDFLNNYWKSPKQGSQNYFSPGVVCPKGWTTAGTLAHGDKTGSAERSGLFTKDPWENYPSEYAKHQLAPDSIWLDILDPSETLAYCCPSGWTGGIWGGCFTSIESFDLSKYPTRCIRVYPDEAVVTVNTVEGTRVSEGIMSIATVTNKYTQLTQALTSIEPEASELKEIAVARVLPAVPLVYRDSDVKAAKDGDDGKDDDKDGDDSNGASKLLAAQGLGPLVAVVAGLLTGAGLLMPW
ncbi:hypothetical protein NW762_011987 [Fusarium torreyae]|uniref:Uncharacterized protein n=1 Tax=Fusarium torreyae TaxID=1237075 RepID=A0A9W8RPV5_9HYPO|nr:hypothetical protein NW762_011987 [Fusarium torreyae]